MLRSLFGEPPRQEAGELQEANLAIREYLQKLAAIPSPKQSPQERKFVIWSQSFIRALDELEQSQYAAARYGEQVDKAYIDQMPAEELVNYHRHIYFYKNAIIRLFAILDKLGYFMNERFELRTEGIKPRFSYFTVLRNMHENGLYPDLEQMLFDLKVKHKEPVTRLRNQRNTEIHTINADLLDDLLQAAEAKYGERTRIETEDIRGNMKDLDEGCLMTFQTVATAFRYLVHPPAAEAQKAREQEKGR
ncbi:MULTISPECIES: Cthe_2314 family HEPN domain-containing protein [Paenibacillus]|uniref:Cthe_2314 family HEPN domain-containing protein n=1 Tax=Paenibacillus TaxID=44249 RepID=UPI0022B902CC|nr:Cthe_2314 family HEPN domain-containing protein [Paenibacillus caseinilyticus]MCZ8522374.1 Cthe_2314 family HEPN domain-containing protein [Paenibacillus caseinilyticus]